MITPQGEGGGGGTMSHPGSTIVVMARGTGYPGNFKRIMVTTSSTVCNLYI